MFHHLNAESSMETPIDWAQHPADRVIRLTLLRPPTPFLSGLAIDHPSKLSSQSPSELTAKISRASA
jgi:hypothetical protein